MLRVSAARTLARRTAVGIGGATVVGGSALTAYAYSDSGAGFRREVQFWGKVAPIVADYYWKTGSSSPLVRYQNWKDDQDETTTEETKIAAKKERRKQVFRQLHETHAPEMLHTILELKGLYVKLGQVLSVTALPLPDPYRVVFRTLQSDVPGWEPFDDVIQPMLENEFGKPLSEIFDYVNPIPCGAASIGQAHEARLKQNDGEHDKVIIKVQYPDAAWKVPADIQCVGDFLKVCVWFGAVDESAATMSFDEFSRQFLAELDYEKERSNLQQIYESSLDPTAPYMKRNVVVPKVVEDLCTKKIITMTYLPGPKVEDEARRQLALLGIDTTKGIGSIVRDAAKDASNPDEPESGELVRRVTKRMETTNSGRSRSPFSWKLTASKIVGQVLGVDSILWAVRFARRLVLWSQAAAVFSIQTLPSRIVSPGLNSWADTHRSASEQAARLSLTKEWMDALFDVHGHQIFNLGLFNADPHPGNILVINENDARPSTKLGLIDFGQCKRLTPQEQVKVARLLLSVAHNESDLAVASAFRDMGITTKNDSTEFLAKFGRLMFGPLKPEHLNHSWHRTLHEQDRVSYFPKELSMVYRTSLLLRGLAVSLQLNYSISDQWKHHAQETMERNNISSS
jgi:aarF domain-containing kinase